MNIADKLRRVLEIKNDIKAALEEKGIEVGDNFSSFADNISNISGGGEEPEPEFIYTPPTKPEINIPEYTGWRKPTDWLDIETIAEENAVEGYPYYIAQLVPKGEATSILGGDYDNSGKTIIKTSDGNTINAFNGSGWNSTEYTWTDEGNDSNYRWVIHYYNTQTISFNNALPGCLWLHLGGGIRVRTSGSTLVIPGGNAITTSGYGIWLSKYDAKYTIRAITGSGNILGCCDKTTIAYRQLFEDWNSLEYLTSDIFDQAHMEQCTDFASMFNQCNSLYTVPQLYTANGTDFYSMFNNCALIKTIPLIDTSNGTIFSEMFNNNRSLITIPLINTSKGTDFSFMFQDCISLRYVPSIDTANGTNLGCIFYNCPRLEWIENLDFTNCLQGNYDNELSNCSALKVINYFRPSPNISQSEVSNNLFETPRYSLRYIGTLDLTGFTSADYLFSGMYGLQYIGNVIGTEEITNFNSMFEGCTSLVIAPMMNTSNGTGFNSMFNSCYALRSVPLYDISKSEIDSGCNYMFNGCSQLQSLPHFDTSNLQSMEYMFSGCNSIKTVPHFDTSKCTSFIDTFSYCSSLTTVPHFDTSNATSIGYMFRDCHNLKYVPDFVTTNVGDFNGVFYGCFNLESVPNFDYSNGYTYSNMFFGCQKLTYIPYIDTSRAFDVSYMFSGCRLLKSIPDIDISQATNVMGLFMGCESLESFPESLNFNSEIYDTTQLFHNCKSLTTIPDRFSFWNTTVTDYMFEGCTKLVSAPIYNFNWDIIQSAYRMFNGCGIGTLPTLQFSNINNMNNIIEDCPNIEDVNIICTSEYMTDLSCSFYNCPGLRNVTLQLDHVTNWGGFSGGSEDHSSPIENITLILPVQSGSTVYIPDSCKKLHIGGSEMYYPIGRTDTFSILRDVTFDSDTLIYCDQDFSDKVFLTKQSILNILNALAEGHFGTLTLPSAQLEELTEEEKAIASDKGWSLA